MAAYQTPQRFPGVNKLPKPAGALLEWLFPKDQIPMPGTVTGPRLTQRLEQVVPDRSNPFMGVRQHGPAVLEKLQGVFKPWGKGLEKAYPQMFGPSGVPAAPESLKHADDANQLLKLLLNRQQHPR